MEPWICPNCGKDMAPRPGAVLRCGEERCPYWRVAFKDITQPTKD